MIGAVRYERRVEYYLDYECENTNLLDYQMKKRLKVKDYNYDGCPKVLVEKTRTYTVTITTPSDGLITKDRATALPGVGYIQKADYVNHDELKNHPEMFRIFNRIFNREIVDSRNKEFFEVEKR